MDQQWIALGLTHWVAGKLGFRSGAVEGQDLMPPEVLQKIKAILNLARSASGLGLIRKVKNQLSQRVSSSPKEEAFEVADPGRVNAPEGDEFVGADAALAGKNTMSGGLSAGNAYGDPGKERLQEVEGFERETLRSEATVDARVRKKVRSVRQEDLKYAALFLYPNEGIEKRKGPGNIEFWPKCLNQVGLSQ